MKQHITPEQLNELTEDQKVKYDKWYRSKYAPMADDDLYIYTSEDGTVKRYDLPPLSIGQMIEFLDEHIEGLDITGRRMYESFLIDISDNTMVWDIWGGEWSSIEDEPVLCDALWEAVKSVLDRQYDRS